MKRVSFTKINGAGNDFIFIDKDAYPDLEITPDLIRKLCHRRFGIGGDGLIAISKGTGFDFEMKYYNSDGSLGSLCGNGARSSIFYASLSGKPIGEKVKFKVGEEFFSGEVLAENLIRFYLNQPKSFKSGFFVPTTKGNIKCHFIDTGSPHVIIDIRDIPDFAGSVDKLDVFGLGKEIRHSEIFAPGGANINFIEIKQENVLIRTYERGVEDETLACGTGSTAAGIICNLVYNLEPLVKLITAGGDELVVDFKHEKDEFRNLSLTGPAKINFTGEFYI